MSDSFAPPRPPGNAPEFSVSEISGALRRTVEEAFGNVRVRGEISGYRGPHSSGHAYFALKDERARIEAVIWKGTFPRLRFRPEEGMEVVAQGKLTTYPGSSKYQIVIESLEPAGAGALMAMLDERKRRLAAEGLFEAGRKRPLPFLPRVIGVVTSPTGAVIRDILHRIADRFPLHVLVWPVRVQGETAGFEATAAVEGFNALEPDGPIPRPNVLIVARGGGSLEDLWGFNDEGLARAVAGSIIPVISAVGHETDWTLIDLAADRRAPTPTGAAEMAVPVKAELEAAVASIAARLRAGLLRLIDRRRQAARAAARALPAPDTLLALPRRRLDEASSRLARGLAGCARAKRARLDAARLVPSLLSRRLGEGRRVLERLDARLPGALTSRSRENRRRLRLASARLSVEPIARKADDRRGDSRRAVARLERAVRLLFDGRRERLDLLSGFVRFEPVAARAAAERARLDGLAARLARATTERLADAGRRAAQAERLLRSLSYQGVLERGFAMVKDEDDRPVTRAAQTRPGQKLSLEWADGTVDATTAKAGSAAPHQPRRKPKPAAGTEEKQASLF
ncbi:MAG TPA: exodeoxyribonuclease VII large subunit [Mesorhizobium sp.]|jgi:exodeoxyribonuclease VII large subunit|nr:exodeoxyribonuclease VII large subunit [Mesorhizobium sp.]